MNLKEVGWGMDWLDMAQCGKTWRALVRAITNFRVPSNAGNVVTS